MKILVLSCDAYSYVWPTFFTLLDKYYPHHPEVYLSTETKQCDFCKTIKTNSQVWTERFKSALEQIPDNYILVMLEDFFIRKPVNEQEILNAEKIMQNNKNIIVCNFELQYRKGVATAYPSYERQLNKQTYLNSCQPSLWNRKLLIERLQKSQTAWEWETSIIDSPYMHLINNTKEYIIDIGYRHQPIEKGGWGITRGKVSQECIDFLKTENLQLQEIPKIKWSIITPYYQALEYTKELAKTLEPQLTDEVEWIIVDDGCNEKALDDFKARVIHLKENSGGASVPRNEGLAAANGEYITFIDADDYVKPNYVSTILNKIKTSNFDYCLFGWQGIGPLNLTVKITDQAPEWNTAVWNCIYKKEKIKNIQFDKTLCIAEDEKFNLEARKGKKENILDILYVYRSGVTTGLTAKQVKVNKKFIKEIPNNQPIYENIFYFNHINVIGGVETFFYELAKKYYNRDITIFYKDGDAKQIARLKELVPVIRFTGQKIYCKKAFFNYNMDIIDNVVADEYYCIIHADFEHFKASPPPQHPKITKYIGVTQAVCDSFTKLTGKPCQRCYNPLTITGGKKILKLISATRLTYEKGGKRIEQLATALDKAGIPYEWIIFSNKKTPIKDHNIIFKDPQLDIYDYLRRADYIVQLSDTESFCYTMVEALSLGTPVIVCPWPCLKELGVNETNAFILPFDMKDIPVQDIYTKEFNFKYHAPQDTWGELLTTASSNYKEARSKRYKVKALPFYQEKKLRDGELGRVPKPGEVWDVSYDRLMVLLGDNKYQQPFVKVVE